MSTLRFRTASKSLYQFVTSEEKDNAKKRERAFASFAKDTDPDWQAMAAHILRRWKTGPEVTPDDIVQELLMAAWSHIPKFDPSMGTDFGDYLVFNSMSRAKKWVHKKRGAILHGNSDSNRSRIPFSLDAMTSEANDRAGRLPEALIGEATQESEFEREQTEKRAMCAIRTVREYHAYTAFVDAQGALQRENEERRESDEPELGLLELATEYLLEDADIRAAANVWGEKQARSVIINTVRTVADHLARTSV
jgi:DNA-directed RNA polymerase specialized sigma24 family protein